MNDIGKTNWKEGMDLLKKKKYNLAIEKFQNALEFFRQKKNNIGESSCLLGISLVNISNNKHEIAFETLEKGIQIVKKINFKPGIASFLMNRGLLFQKLKKFNNALKDYESSLELFIKINDINAIKNLQNIIKNCNEEKGKNKSLDDPLKRNH